MPSYCHLGLSLEMVYPSHAVKCVLWPNLASVQYPQCTTTTICLNYRERIIQRTCNLLASLNYARLHSLKPIASVGQLHKICESHSTEVELSPLMNMAMDGDIEVDSFSVPNGSLSDRTSKEEQRRRKIGLANKGKVPWNKGRKHTKETRMRIKQRTTEALRNPEVRKKMSEHPQLHRMIGSDTLVNSDETKKKIRSSVKQVWAKRSKQKQSKEKFVSSWSENISEAAMKGGLGQQELDWNSYDRMKEEIASQQLQLAAEKARAIELAELRSQRAAELHAERKERLSERMNEREEKARRETKIVKTGHNKKNAAVASELKLKQRLTKIYKKKPNHGRVAVGRDRVISVIPKWEKLDMEIIKKERMRREISLADQIQAAKSRRTNEALSTYCPQP